VQWAINAYLVMLASLFALGSRLADTVGHRRMVVGVVVIAGGLTAVGPVLGGYLTEWTWRAILWVNIPVAVVALVLIAVSKPATDHEWAPVDYRGLVLIAGGVALSVLGVQQSATWGWSDPATGLCVAAGVVLRVGFVLVEVALGKTAQESGLCLLYFFLGFVVASQIGGRILDRRGPRPRSRWAAPCPPPASPRRCATTRPAWASPSSAPSWSPGCAPG
jgi:MFS family permease